MRKLIEIQQENLIECDNKNCDYVIKNPTKDPNENVKRFVNMPCPKCGDNLLTEKDYLEGERFMQVLNWVNKWFSWVTIFIPCKYETKSSVTIHNGITIKDEN
jgi:predicted nucleic-acid-binding Zn-ribbon protein